MYFSFVNVSDHSVPHPNIAYKAYNKGSTKYSGKPPLKAGEQVTEIFSMLEKKCYIQNFFGDADGNQGNVLDQTAAVINLILVTIS